MDILLPADMITQIIQPRQLLFPEMNLIQHMIPLLIEYLKTLGFCRSEERRVGKEC